MNNESIKKVTYLVLSLGVILNVYLAVSHAMESTFNFIIIPALNVLPYLICLIISMKARRSIMALCAGLSILVTDILLFNNFIINQRAL